MIVNDSYSVDFAENENLFTYKLNDSDLYSFSPPTIEVENQSISFPVSGWIKSYEKEILNGITEILVESCSSTSIGEFVFQVLFRVTDRSPISRYSYRFYPKDDKSVKLSRSSDDIKFSYGTVFFKKSACNYTEVQLSHFDRIEYSYRLNERKINNEEMEYDQPLAGPIICSESDKICCLWAYEHGSNLPDTYLNFFIKENSISLKESKGNYVNGQKITKDSPFQTIWLQFGAIKGNIENISKKYRQYVLHSLSIFKESREPYLYYNTWNSQERDNAWNGNPYLNLMNQDRINRDIETAHRMGIDIFVIDTGWYSQTGAWKDNKIKFPDGIKAIHKKLSSKGMKLGLWFGPHIARSLSQAKEYKDCIYNLQKQDEDVKTKAVWETEESYYMCLASRYWEAFADELIRCYEEYGVTYFKWDAIGQRGCSSPFHNHGNENCSPKEREEAYSFSMPLYLNKIAERVCKSVPGAIVDFDMTEPGRSFGLDFLSVGKYFMVNNGPYYRTFDDPEYSPGGGMGANVFVFPGPARARIVRGLLDFDKWIPSILMLSHFLPDGPHNSQNLNLASLLLGQNGIWGDLESLSSEEVDYISTVVSNYKKIKYDVTEAYPKRFGPMGGTPEIHEKINHENKKGMIAIFSPVKGNFRYISQNTVGSPYFSTANCNVKVDENRKALIDINFTDADAALIFFK